MTWEDILKEKDYKFGPMEDGRTKEARDKRVERIMEQRKKQAMEIAQKTSLMVTALTRTIKNINITSTNKEDLDEFLDDLQEIIELTAQSWESKYSTDMLDGVIPEDARQGRKTQEHFADMNREVSSKLDRFRKGD